MENEYGFWIIAIGNIAISFFLSLALNYSSRESRNGFKYKGKACFLTASCIYVLLLMMRKIDRNYIGGNDSLNMYYVFKRAKGQSFFSFWPDFSYREFGYSLITWWFSNHNIHYKILLLIMYMVSIYMLIIFLKKINYQVKDVCSFLALGLLVAYLIYEINLQRNCMAIFVALNVYVLFLQKKYYKGLLLLFFGIQIHLSMIILLPLVFLLYLWNKKIFSINMLFSFMFILTVVLLCIIPILIQTVPFLKHYRTYFIWGFNGIKQPIIILIAFIIFLKPSIFRRLNDIDKGLVVVLGYAIIVFSFAIYISMAYRLLFYFMPVLFILLAKALGTKKINIIYLDNFIQVAISLIIFIYGYSMFYGSYYVTGGVYKYIFAPIWELPL